MRAAIACGLAVVSLASPASLAAAHDGSDDGVGDGHSQTRGHTAQLEQLRDRTTAYASGPAAPWSTQVYDLAGITCIEDPGGTGAMGIHVVDVDNLLDGSVDRLAPETLIYEPGPGGSLSLVAVEYLVLADDWDAAHPHAPILYGRKLARVGAGNRYGLPAFYELHVWHAKSNPEGLFNDWNPRVQCG